VKLSLSSFGALLVSGLCLLMFALWLGSLLVFAERQNQQADSTLQHNLQLQIQQLKQNQQLWLQSQYYLLNTLAKSPHENQNFQSFLWGYYQRNPSIWAVNRVQFNERGLPLSKSSKPGCLQPDELLHFKFDNFLVPRISSCRIDDKALLEIAGPVVTNGAPMVLLVSMDYFDFLHEFSNLTGRKLQRAADTEQGFQFYEFGLGENEGERIRIELSEVGDVFGEIYLNVHSLSFWTLFDRQIAIVLALLLLGALLVLALLNRYLLKPAQALARDMHHAVHGRQPEDATAVPKLHPGLGKLSEYFELMQKTALRDAVTGLNNRVIFEDRLAQAIREGKRSGRKYALVMIDLRGLDDLVQQRGQYIVDALLRQVAEGLRESLRESDNLSRFERNLFALLLEVQQREQLHSLVEKLYLSLIHRYRVYDREFELNAFIGVAIYPDHAVDADGLYEKASTALLAAEHSDWPIEYFRENEDETDTSGFSMIQSLRRAIERDELKLVYQPVVDLQTHQTVYFEALLRWKDPERHDTSIEQTIRLAEQNHLIKSLTNWIIESACRFVSEQDLGDVAVGINMSMIDLHDRRLPERIQTYLQQYGLRPAQIVIEITEGQIMQEPDKVIEVLAHLGVMGLSLSIDDFGTGQASLTYLKEMPVEKLKIDQSFVHDMASNPDDQLIVRATIELAHTLDLKVVAEGVETLAVYEMLAEMHCDHVQGYYISHPLEEEQVAGWFATSVKPDLLRKG
jgi:diguanylate cyclase (GGDEF)-like protein